MVGRQVSATSDKYLRREFIESAIMGYMENHLVAFDFMPKVRTDSRSYTFFKEESSMGASDKKKAPKKMTASGPFPEVEIARIQAESGLLNKIGFQVVLDEDALTQNNFDDLNRAYKHLAFWIASDMNSEIFEAIKDEAQTSSATVSDWSDPSNNPIEDLRLVKNTMKQNGYPYRGTDFFLHDDQWEELEGYLMSIDAHPERQSRLFGWPSPRGDTLRVPVIGCDVTRVDTGIDTGNLLLLDRSNPAGSVYYNINPKYGSQEISYVSMVNDAPQVKTVPNFGLQVHPYFDDEFHLYKIQAWVDFAVGIKAPKAAFKKSGI